MSNLTIKAHIAIMILATVCIFAIVFYAILSTVLGAPALILSLVMLVGFIMIVVNQVLLDEHFSQ